MFKATRIFILVCVWFACIFNAQAKNRPDTLRVLAIGNSFSQDAIEQYLHELAAASGKPMIIGNLYIGGAPLSLHWENAKGDKPAYGYRKIAVDGKKVEQEHTSIASALKDEPWDYVSLQQVSQLSGKFDTYVEPLTALYRYIDSVKAGHIKYIWHQTWAYSPNATHTGFSNYGRDQHTMYRAITDASAKTKELVPIDLLIPAGTAIQNARTSFLGDDLTRDGFHLDLHIGRFIAACTWYESLFREQAQVNRYRPEQVSEAAAEVAREAAHGAARKPFSVTEIGSKEKNSNP